MSKHIEILKDIERYLRMKGDSVSLDLWERVSLAIAKSEEEGHEMDHWLEEQDRATRTL